MNSRKVVKNTQPPISSRGPKTPISHTAETRGNTRIRPKVNTLRNTNDANGRLKTRNNQGDEVIAPIKGKSVIQDTSELPYSTPYKV